MRLARTSSGAPADNAPATHFATPMIPLLPRIVCDLPGLAFNFAIPL